MEPVDIKRFKDVSIHPRLPRIIAHRGASLEAPENTLPAFQRALDLGADGIEFDVLLTSDKVPVVTHNDDLSILTHFNGYVHSTPFETVRALDVGSHFHTSTAGITMPTMVEVLELMSRHDVLTIVEIKAQAGMKKSAAELIGGIISDIRMHGPIVISSSSFKIIKELKHRFPTIPRALIVKRTPFPFFPLSIFAKHEQVCALHVYMKALWPSLVKKMKKLGEVYAWTVNEPDEFDTCLSLEIDGIITDDVAFAKKHLQGISAALTV
ncbi:MAG: glycerophosphodiester phosphodiesterase family protein [Pseudomonadota bacterium]